MVKRVKESTFTNDKGFTLVEVMIAMAIFAVFITAFLMSQSSNIVGSSQMAEEITLHNLAESKINEILIDPPKFTNATENDVESKNFEDEGFKQYKYTIEYKKITFPNLADLMGDGDEEDQQPDENQGIKKIIYQNLKKNLEKMLWQVKVTITNTETDYQYSLSSWIPDSKAKVDTNFGF